MTYWGLKYGIDDIKSELRKIEERLDELNRKLEKVLEIVGKEKNL